MRVGIGFDIHPFILDKKLIVGGIEIPFHSGLQGHSDADVLLHSICDALLGALNLGDIGTHFPNTDPNYSGYNSLGFLTKVYQLITNKGWELSNLDSIVIAENPKISPYIPSMVETISQSINVHPELISIKATTTEKLGFIGREEGMAAKAIVLLKKIT